MKILYTRVSSKNQNLDRQLTEIDKYDKVFSEKLSGKDTKRPQLQEMISFCRKGDSIYVKSIDRLARSISDLHSIIDTLQKKRVEIHFLTENISFYPEGTYEKEDVSKNLMNDLLFNLLAVFSQFERSCIKRRAKEGLDLYRKAGGRMGPRKTLTEEQIKNLKEDRWAGIPVKELAEKYKISSPSVYRLLKKWMIYTETKKKRLYFCLKYSLFLFQYHTLSTSVLYLFC